jgi:beta-galactosidase
MRKTILSVLLFASALHGQVKLQHRETLNIDAGWKFYSGDAIGAQAGNYNDADWRDLNLPHDWSIEREFKQDNPGGGSNGYLPGGVGWYRKQLPLPSGMKGRRVLIQFDGVFMNSDVWVNEHFLGRYPSGFSTFYYDISEYLKFDGPNVIAVRVDNANQPAARWYTGAGIYRHVWLIAADPLHIEQWGTTVTTPQASRDEATVRIATRLMAGAYPETKFVWYAPDASAYRLVTKNCKLTSQIFDENDALVGETSTLLSVPNFSKQEVIQEIRLKQPALWSVSTPHLYKVYSSLDDGTRVVDDYLTPFGIRQLTYSAEKGFLLNDEPMKIKGCCLHQDAGPFGRAVPLKIWETRLRLLKKMGCNAVRMHCPHAPEFYDLCDRLGFFILNDAFDEWRCDWESSFSESPRGKVEYGYNKYFEQWHQTDLRNFIRLNRNHPSVFLWSLGNEIPEQYVKTPGAVARLKELVDICREEDPTRGTTVAIEGALPQVLNKEFITAVGVAGFNYVDIKNGSKYYEPYHQMYPDRLLLGTETVFTLGNWLAVKNNDYVMGQFMWVGIDYLGEAVWPKHGWDRGLIDLTGHPKPEYYFRQSLWSDAPMVYLTVGDHEIHVKGIGDIWNMPAVETHWNWPTGSTQPVIAYTTCDEVELFLNGQSLGTKKLADFPDLKIKWAVPFAPGILQAVGRKNGAAAAAFALETADKPAKLSVTTESVSIIPDGRDIAVVNVSIADKNGIPVAGADPFLDFEITGGGTVLRTCSGNLGDQTPYPATGRKAFKGRCQAIIRSNGQKGDITVTVRSEGLPPGSVTIRVE